jgi:hypothetical protein
MKRLLFTVIVLAGTFAHAQGIKFGVKAGVDFASI